MHTNLKRTSGKRRQISPTRLAIFVCTWLGIIGAELGHSGYVRDRPLEFSTKNLPRTELIEKINATIKVVCSTLESQTEEQLAAEYPQLVLENRTTTAFFMVHLVAHLNYHLGQINYHIKG